MALNPIYIDSSISGAQLSIGTINSSTINIGNVNSSTNLAGITNSAILKTTSIEPITTSGNLNIASTTNTGAVTIGNLANTTTLAGSTKIGTVGTSFRCIKLGQNVGTGSATGTITIAGAPTTFGNPLIFLSMNVPNTNTIFITHSVTGTGSFTYNKTYYRTDATTIATVISGAPSESFNYIAIWL